MELDLAAKYEARGVPTDWEDLTPDVMLPAFHLYWRAFKSPSGDPDGDKGLAEKFLHDPATELREAGLIGDGDVHISTMVVNHEKTLKRFIMYAMVVVSNNPNTVGITIAKETE